MPFNASTKGSFGVQGKFARSRITPGVQVFNYTGAAQYFNIPSGAVEITVKMWGASGGEYNANINLNNGGGCGGYTETTFNVIESVLTVIVGGGSGYAIDPGFGGGGGGYNGGSNGGGCSAIFSGNISTPFSIINNSSTPSNTVKNLIGASGVIAVAGGGGGAGWYQINNMYGGGGGGLLGANSSGGYTGTTGGSQSSSTNGSGSADAGKLSGGRVSITTNNGGSGGGGGGWYGGGTAQGSTFGQNTSGSGGSGFIGYVNGSTSTVLSANQANGRDYIDTILRVNGTRYYKNSKCLSSDAGVFVPPNNTDTYYSAGIAVPTYYPGNDGTAKRSGDGKVVILYS